MRARTTGSKRWLGNVVITGLFLLTIGLIAWRLSGEIRVMRGPSESELRAHLIESGRLVELEAWAMPKIGQSLDVLKGDAQPPDGEVGRVADALAMTDDAGRIQYFRLELGGGFRHRGLLIGDVPNPHMFPHRYSNRWNERVVYYDEVPQE